jgi:hypothetical protein
VFLRKRVHNDLQFPNKSEQQTAVAAPSDQNGAHGVCDSDVSMRLASVNLPEAGLSNQTTETARLIQWKRAERSVTPKRTEPGRFCAWFQVLKDSQYNQYRGPA